MNNWVTIKTEVVEEALAWAKKHCPHYITNNYHKVDDVVWDTNHIDFFFVNNHPGQKEMLMFRLMWQ